MKHLKLFENYIEPETQHRVQSILPINRAGIFSQAYIRGLKTREEDIEARLARGIDAYSKKGVHTQDINSLRLSKESDLYSICKPLLELSPDEFKQFKKDCEQLALDFADQHNLERHQYLRKGFSLPSSLRPQWKEYCRSEYYNLLKVYGLTANSVEEHIEEEEEDLRQLRDLGLANTDWEVILEIDYYFAAQNEPSDVKDAFVDYVVPAILKAGYQINLDSIEINEWTPEDYFGEEFDRQDFLEFRLENASNDYDTVYEWLDGVIPGRVFSGVYNLDEIN